jgi:hypothetical protein
MKRDLYATVTTRSRRAQTEATQHPPAPTSAAPFGGGGDQARKQCRIMNFQAKTMFYCIGQWWLFSSCK